MLKCLTCGKDLSHVVEVLGDDQYVMKSHMEAHRADAIRKSVDMTESILDLLGVIKSIPKQTAILDMIRSKAEGIKAALSADVRFTEG